MGPASLLPDVARRQPADHPRLPGLSDVALQLLAGVVDSGVLVRKHVDVGEFSAALEKLQVVSCWRHLSMI